MVNDMGDHGEDKWQGGVLGTFYEVCHFCRWLGQLLFVVLLASHHSLACALCILHPLSLSRQTSVLSAGASYTS